MMVIEHINPLPLLASVEAKCYLGTFYPEALGQVGAHIFRIEKLAGIDQNQPLRRTFEPPTCTVRALLDTQLKSNP